MHKHEDEDAKQVKICLEFYLNTNTDANVTVPQIFQLLTDNIYLHG